jgi:acetylglutamate kinase
MSKHVSCLYKRIGKKEVDKWIDIFRSYERPFSVLKIGGESLQCYLDDICNDLAILSELELSVPLVYGWNTAFTKKLKENGITTEKDPETGDRITKKEDLPYLKEIAEEQGMLIADKLKSRGVKSKILYGVFSAERKELNGVRNHYTGNCVGVSTDEVIWCIDQGIIPLLPPLGYTYDGQLMNINGDMASTGLVLDIRPKKLIFATNTGGILENGKIIAEISLERDYDRLIEDGIITKGMIPKLDASKAAIEGTPPEDELIVQIANPKDIPEELFTDVGKGTYIRR